MVAVSHSTSHICSTSVANLIATKYEMYRTSTQRIRTSTNVEGRLLLHYFNYQHPVFVPVSGLSKVEVYCCLKLITYVKKSLKTILPLSTVCQKDLVRDFLIRFQT